MTLSYADLSALKNEPEIWYADITLSDGHGSTRVLRASDASVSIGTSVASSTQYEAIVAAWDTIYSGQTSVSSDAYTMATIAVRLFVRHTGDQDHDHNLLDVLTAFELHGGLVELYHRYARTNLTASPQETIRFTGRVFEVPAGGITADLVECQARAEFDTGIIPSRVLRKSAFPDVLEGVEDFVVPSVIGRQGFHYGRFTAGKTSVSGVENADWRNFCLIEGASPAAVSDKTSLTVQVSSLQISTDALDGETSPGCFWPDDPHSGAIFEDLASGDYDESGGTIDIPTLSGSDYNGVANDGDIAIRKFDMPSTQLDALVGTSAWTDPTNAFTRDLETYAEIVGDGTVLGVQGGQSFLSRPPGCYDNSNIPDLTDGASHKMVAMFYTSTSVEVRMTIVGSTGATWTEDSGTLSSGYHMLEHELSDSAVAVTLQHQLWGEAGSEGITIQLLAPSSGDILRVYMFGVSYVDLMPPGPFLEETRRIQSRSGGYLPYGNVAPPSFYYAGFGSEYASSGLTHPAHALERMLIESTADADTPLTSVDLDHTTGGHGSFLVFEDDLDDGHTAACRIIEDGEPPLTDMIASFQSAYFCRVWRSRLDGKWKVRRKATDLASDGRVLYRHNLAAPEVVALQLGFTPVSEVANAIYLDYDYDPITGRYRQSVWIDNTAKGSMDDTGAVAGSALADRSQELFGRREMRIRSKYIDEPETAAQAIQRRFDWVYRPRLVLRATVDREFAGTLEETEIIGCDADLDDVMRLPLWSHSSSPFDDENEPSWADARWWVNRIAETPGGPMVVEAVYALGVE